MAVNRREKFFIFCAMVTAWLVFPATARARSTGTKREEETR